MASSNDLRVAVGMGMAVISAMLLSSIVISIIHKIVPEQIKLPAYLLIITGFVSLISMLMQAYFPEVVDMIGVHLATLAVSAAVFRDAEEVADHVNVGTAIKTALFTGIFFTAVMSVCALIREVLGRATICGQPIEILANFKVSAIFGAFGGYVVLAIVLAIINKIIEFNKEKEDN